MECLLDTNLLLRAVDPASAQQAIARQAINRLLARRYVPCLISQNIIEFWAVATRPADMNGFGWDTLRTATEVRSIMAQFNVLDEPASTFARWMQLVESLGISGKKVHDARFVAAMLSLGITHLLTFNVSDFTRYGTAITLLNPNTFT